MIWKRAVTFAAPCLLLLGAWAAVSAETGRGALGDGAGQPSGANAPAAAESDSVRAGTIVASLTVFVLAVFVGFEVITKVPPTLHTPLMSGSNAISGITVVGALIVTGDSTGLPAWLGMIAVVLAAINVVGGFLVTHRMLSMFQKR